MLTKTSFFFVLYKAVAHIHASDTINIQNNEFLWKPAFTYENKQHRTGLHWMRFTLCTPSFCGDPHMHGPEMKKKNTVLDAFVCFFNRHSRV